MDMSLLNDTVALGNLLVVLAILGLFGGGLAMIAIGTRRRAEMLARRVDKIQRQPSRDVIDNPRSRPEERLAPRASQGLTDAEQRQVVRFYTKLGVSTERTVFYFNLTRVLLLVGFGVGAAFFGWGLAAKSLPLALLVVLVAVALGWFLPLLLVRRGVTKHYQSVGQGLPDALELLAVCVEVGLSLENGLQRVSRELRRAQPALSEELALTWAEFNILPNRDQALFNLAERVDIPPVRSVVTTLSQTLRFGTPLARALRVVAGEVRNDQLTQMEEKANRLPAMMTVPVMLFIMPTIFLIVGGPAALKVMDMFAR